ncbi:MAG: DUF1294 domain-containing protein, partial [Planctomycetota bacterium]
MADARRSRFRSLWPWLLAVGWVGFLALAVAWDRLPWWLALVEAAFSALAFPLQGWDKWRAGRGGRRVPEAALHLIELLGGWPGALIGRRLFRHKTVKVKYRLT